jgi:serine/threonine protein kinase
MSSPLGPETSGRRIGDFEITREIGRGGMGVVYEAQQVSLNRQVALKLLGGGLALIPKAVQRFRREAEAAAKLHHTNIVPVYATGEQDGTHFYAMELIEGPSLDRVLRQLRAEREERMRATEFAPVASCSTVDRVATGPYVPSAPSASETAVLASSSLGSDGHYFDTVARLVAEVADGLEYAHRQGVIHRDIKPSNLLLSPAGRLSINDFGLARLLEQPGMTLTGEFVGTPAYMSPEQITAGRIPLDHRTDIYSLGATLYELLTLQRPFDGKRRDQVLAQIVQKEPKAPRKMNKKVPRDLETICLKALEKDPDRRYQTAGAMADDLRRYANRYAISARRAGPVNRAVKWVRRRPAVAAAEALALLALLAVLAAGFFAHRAHLQGQQLQAEKERHEQQLLEEKRQNALDKALLAAMGGDFDGAEKAIAEAELLQASTGQVRMLRGQVALHRGQIQEAFEHLRLAVELLPESVAVRSCLAIAYASVARYDKYEQTMQEVERLPTRTPEDLLFKGRAESQVDAERGLATLQEASGRRPSILAHLFRAEVQVHLASDLTDLAKAGQLSEAALKEADTAKRLLPGNAVAIGISLDANLTAADIYGDTGRLAERDKALARAEEDARSLGPFSTSPHACRCIFRLLQEEGRDSTLVEKLRGVSEHTGFEVVTYLLGVSLYRRQEFAACFDALDKKPGGFLPDLVRLIVFADQDRNPTRALAAYKNMAVPDLDPRRELKCLMILRLLGHKTESELACIALSKKPDGFAEFNRPDSSRRLVEYGAGKLGADQLLLAAAASKMDLCEAHFFIAITRLADGDRAGARDHLRAAFATHARVLTVYDLSWAFLARMEKDPDWPPWIPVKK